MGQQKLEIIPLNIVITTSNRIESLSSVITSVFNTRKKLKENGLDINYCILSSDSDSEEYNLICENLIKKNSKTVDYFFKIKSNKCFDRHYFKLISKIKELENNEKKPNYFYFIGDDDLISFGPFLNICYSIISKPKDAYIYYKSRNIFKKRGNKNYEFDDLKDMYKFFWNQIKYGDFIYKPNFKTFYTSKNNLDCDHLNSIHFWHSLLLMKKRKYNVLVCDPKFSIDLRIKKLYKNKGISSYLRKIPISISLTSKLLNLEDKSILRKYLLWRVGFVSPVGLMRSFYILKSFFKGERLTKRTFMRSILFNKFYIIGFSLISATKNFLKNLKRNIKS